MWGITYTNLYNEKKIIYEVFKHKKDAFKYALKNFSTEDKYNTIFVNLNNTLLFENVSVGSKVYMKDNSSKKFYGIITEINTYYVVIKTLNGQGEVTKSTLNKKLINKELFVE